MALIELEQVEVCYGPLKALDGVSCAIEGGAVGLLGPNGAGKSTLIKTLLGFNRPKAGAVRVMGKTLPKEALAVRQLLGYMPEREVISPKVSAVSFITYCGRLFGMKRTDAMERTHEVLNYVGLGESRYRKMETYSTGMLQRVKLAQALVHDPKLLLLDEPTNGLDPDGRIEMLELIREVASKERATVLLSSHLLPDVEEVCDRVIVIQRGKISREGRISDLTARREREYVVRVRDNLAAFLGQLAGAGMAWREKEAGTLSITLPEGAAPEGLFALAHTCGAQIRHFEPARFSLEEAFVQSIEPAAEAGKSEPQAAPLAAS